MESNQKYYKEVDSLNKEIQILLKVCKRQRKQIDTLESMLLHKIAVSDNIIEDEAYAAYIIQNKHSI